MISLETKAELRTKYQEQGFAIIENAVPVRVIRELEREADRFLGVDHSRGGARNLLHRSDRFRSEGKEGTPSKFARWIVGSGARPTNLTLFDKTPSANWLVQWHQDLTIAVREQQDEPGFTSWSLKEGVVHVQPPVEVLRNIVAIRVHLHDTPASNGALRVLPGSHRLGRLTRESIAAERTNRAEIVCEVSLGGLMLMSPLLLHASSKASLPHSRRVLHFEYSANALPGGLEWA